MEQQLAKIKVEGRQFISKLSDKVNKKLIKEQF